MENICLVDKVFVNWLEIELAARQL